MSTFAVQAVQFLFGVDLERPINQQRTGLLSFLYDDSREREIAALRSAEARIAKAQRHAAVAAQRNAQIDRSMGVERPPEYYANIPWTPAAPTHVQERQQQHHRQRPVSGPVAPPAAFDAPLAVEEAPLPSQPTQPVARRPLVQPTVCPATHVHAPSPSGYLAGAHHWHAGLVAKQPVVNPAHRSAAPPCGGLLAPVHHHHHRAAASAC